MNFYTWKKLKLNKKKCFGCFSNQTLFKKIPKGFFLFPRYKFHHVIRIDKQKVIVHKSTLELSAKLS